MLVGLSSGFKLVTALVSLYVYDEPFMIVMFSELNIYIHSSFFLK